MGVSRCAVRSGLGLIYGHQTRRRGGAGRLDPERIVVTHGTTANAPMDQGAGASRVTHVVGQAARLGAAAMKQRLEELASEAMGWPAGAVTIESDRFLLNDGSGESASYDDVMRQIASGPPVQVDGRYESEHAHGDPGDFNFFGYAVETRVDPDTGAFSIVDVTLVVDVGTIINPVAHQGQLDGGFVYGLGNTVLEEMTMDEGKVVTLNLGEYKLPTIDDVPKFRTVLLKTTIGPGPFGAKMAGEGQQHWHRAGVGEFYRRCLRCALDGPTADGRTYSGRARGEDGNARGDGAAVKRGGLT